MFFGNSEECMGTEHSGDRGVDCAARYRPEFLEGGRFPPDSLDFASGMFDINEVNTTAS